MGADPVRPEPDVESESFWRALGQHRLELQQCQSCGRTRFPPMPTCPYCASRQGQVLAGSGRGRVYSLVTVHQALTPALAGAVPYTVAVIELEEGARMLGRVEPALEADIGTTVEAFFVDHDAWTELRFRPC